MAELLTRPRQTAPFFPEIFLMIVGGVCALAWPAEHCFGQDKRGPGSFDLAIQPRAPGRYGCLEASRAA
jgi:hypothetical protein